jgi:predicted lactoylglutathione lyase
MARAQSRLFVNLAVRDLARSVAFFSALGFEFNPTYTDDRAACLIVSSVASVMLLAQPFFARFIGKEPCDARTHGEASIALTCSARRELKALLERALAAGATRAPGYDYGFVCASGFYDLDGHHWQLTWSDPHRVLA